MKINQPGLYRVRNGNVAMVNVVMTGNPDIGMPVIGKMFYHDNYVVCEEDMAWDEYGQHCVDETFDLIKFMPVFVSDPPVTHRNTSYLRRNKQTQRPTVVNEQIWSDAKAMKENVGKLNENTIGDMLGDFYKNESPQWFIRTHQHSFVWNNPDYGGNGEITLSQFDLKGWRENSGLVDKYMGKKVISNYVGKFKFV